MIHTATPSTGVRLLTIDRQERRNAPDTDTPVPVMTAVNGPALGAGMQLVIAGDLCVAAPAARFGVPAAKLGLAVDRWTVERVVHLLGGATARLVLLAAEDLDATAAVACGLAQRAGDLDDALDWAVRIARLAPLTLKAHKLALSRRGAEADAAVQACWLSADFAEGVSAFRDGRSPSFEGR